MTRYLVTGGLGVVGSCFVREVVARGDTAIVIDACEAPRNDWLADVLRAECKDAVDIHVARLEELWAEKLATEVLTNCDAVIHAAAHTGIPHSADAADDDWLSNVDATKRLLDALRLCPKPTVIMSSVKPYRVHDLPYGLAANRFVWTERTQGIDETCVLEPDEPYAASKMAQSALGMAYARTFDLPVTVLRFSNLYAPAPCHGPRHGWLTWFCISAALGVPVQRQGSGMQVRDMLFSTDINAALKSALEHMPACQGNVYNVGGGFTNAVSVNEAIDLLRGLGPLAVHFAPGRKNEDPIFITDHSKFTKITGWSPTASVSYGVSTIYQWAVQNLVALQKVYADWL